MKKTLQDAIPFAEAFARLLHPFGEVVLHDLSKDRIEAIYNSFSRREVGDSSYLDRIDFDDSERIIGPYEKTNWDGRSLKSISIVLRNPSGKAEGFLCVNVDISAFSTVNQMLQMFINNNASLPEKSQMLFKDDLYERINLYVQQYCKEQQTSMDALKHENKRELIQLLSQEGAFQGKNAANYMARILGISRATVYNYLNKGKS